MGVKSPTNELIVDRIVPHPRVGLLGEEFVYAVSREAKFGLFYVCADVGVNDRLHKEIELVPPEAPGKKKKKKKKERSSSSRILGASVGLKDSDDGHEFAQYLRQPFPAVNAVEGAFFAVENDVRPGDLLLWTHHFMTDRFPFENVLKVLMYVRPLKLVFARPPSGRRDENI